MGISSVGGTTSSSSPPYFIQIDVLTDLIMERTLTNISLFAYLWSLVGWIISGTLTLYDFVTSTKYFFRHTSCVSCSPFLILKLFSLGISFQRDSVNQQEHMWCQKYLHSKLISFTISSSISISFSSSTNAWKFYLRNK